ncbi:MAG: hypothetical protein R2770_05885 [Acidimicrobiales bacterium]|nr:hypothetical protein [Acidimicrobiales bacterium]
MEDRREWISFDDPDEERTWMFDVTFLGSGYGCIYGRGCQGIGPEPDEAIGCCEHGAYMSDEADERAVTDAVARYLGPDNWQLQVDDPFETVSSDPEADDASTSRKTKVVDGACVFLNRADFARGAGCALHLAALDGDVSPHELKPEVCWQVPVRREDHETETGHIYTMVREWARRDWGEGGADFGWWCTTDPSALNHARPAYVSLRDELVAICGEHIYDELARRMDELGKASPPLMWPRSRPT